MCPCATCDGVCLGRQEDEAGGDAGTPASSEPVGSLLLARRSLLVVRDDAYHRLLHGIEPRDHDLITDAVLNRGETPCGERLTRDTRVSLTIRHVPKVLKVRLRL